MATFWLIKKIYWILAIVWIIVMKFRDLVPIKTIHFLYISKLGYSHNGKKDCSKFQLIIGYLNSQLHRTWSCTHFSVFFMATICLVIKCTLNPSSISVLQYLSCIFFCFLLIFSFFFLFFAGECIPPRTTALAASTFNLYVSLASVDVNTFQVSCQPACSLPPPKSFLPHSPALPHPSVPLKWTNA